MLGALKESVVFNKIKIEDIKKILEETKHEIKTYSPNETIAFRGDEVKGLYVILKGTLSTEMLTEEGNVIKIEELVKSDVIASAFIFGSKNCFPVDLKAKEKEVAARLYELEDQVVRKRDRLSKAMQERKTYEILREKALEAYYEEEKQEAMKLIDEQVSFKYSRE